MLRQVKFHYEAGFFNNGADALEILADLQTLFERINKQCQTGKKLSLKQNATAADYVFYSSDLMLGTNSVQVDLGAMRVCYVNYNSINFMSCKNEFFNNSIKYWIDNIISKSTLLSLVSEKYRNQLFKQFIRQVEVIKDGIK
jgi:hypothetical protein